MKHHPAVRIAVRNVVAYPQLESASTCFPPGVRLLCGAGSCSAALVARCNASLTWTANLTTVIGGFCLLISSNRFQRRDARCGTRRQSRAKNFGQRRAFTESLRLPHEEHRHCRPIRRPSHRRDGCTQAPRIWPHHRVPPGNISVHRRASVVEISYLLSCREGTHPHRIFHDAGQCVPGKPRARAP